MACRDCLRANEKKKKKKKKKKLIMVDHKAKNNLVQSVSG